MDEENESAVDDQSAGVTEVNEITEVAEEIAGVAEEDDNSIFDLDNASVPTLIGPNEQSVKSLSDPQGGYTPAISKATSESLNNVTHMSSSNRDSAESSRVQTREK